MLRDEMPEEAREAIRNGNARTLSRQAERMIREERERRAWRLRQQGLQTWEIAQQLEVPESAVCKMVKKKEDEIQKRFLQDGLGIKAEQIGRLELFVAELIQAWYRSQEDAVETTTGLAMLNQRDGTVHDMPDKIVRRGQTGNHNYMAMAMKAMEDIRKIAGLNAPEKQEITIHEDTAMDSLKKKLEDLAKRTYEEQQRAADGVTVVEDDRTEREQLAETAEEFQARLRARANAPKSLLDQIPASARADSAEGREV